MSGLLECPGCGRFTRALPDGRCRNCRVGWVSCATHGRLEWASSEHRRVTVLEVVQAVPLAAGGGR